MGARKIALTASILIIGISAVHLSSKAWTEWNSLPQFDQIGDMAWSLRPLPIGASFDPEVGILYCQPEPGFVGEYTFIFVKNNGTEKVRKKVKVLVGGLK